MNKRLEKRHKRQVARTKERNRVSEPDLRTPEQLAAAREVSRSMSGRRSEPRPNYVTTTPNRAAPVA